MANFLFFLNEKPKCQLCGSDLNFSLHNKNELKILSCKNENCPSKESIANKHKAFLPNEINEAYKKERRKSAWRTVEYWTSRGYSEEEAKKEISRKQSISSKLVKNRPGCRKEMALKKYGSDADFFLRKRSIWCKEYWINKGYTEKESEKKVSEFQSEMSKRKLSKSIDERRKANCRCVEYWTSRGYSEEEAKEKISELQSTFNLEKCIKKYGKEEGYKRWKERQIKWQDSLNDSGFYQLGHSKISQELFNSLIKEYSNDDKDYIFYENKNKEYTLKNDNGFYYRYDFCDLKRRKFIEFNGDIYHANPKLYSENDKPNPFRNKTAKELWDVDNDKQKIAERNGFKEFVVWEKDYREDKEKIINECLKFLFDNEEQIK